MVRERTWHSKRGVETFCVNICEPNMTLFFQWFGSCKGTVFFLFSCIIVKSRFSTQNLASMTGLSEEAEGDSRSQLCSRGTFTLVVTRRGRHMVFQRLARGADCWKLSDVVRLYVGQICWQTLFFSFYNIVDIDVLSRAFHLCKHGPVFADALYAQHKLWRDALDAAARVVLRMDDDICITTVIHVYITTYTCFIMFCHVLSYYTYIMYICVMYVLVIQSTWLILLAVSC